MGAGVQPAELPHPTPGVSCWNTRTLGPEELPAGPGLPSLGTISSNSDCRLGVSRVLRGGVLGAPQQGQQVQGEATRARGLRVCSRRDRRCAMAARKSSICRGGDRTPVRGMEGELGANCGKPCLLLPPEHPSGHATPHRAASNHLSLWKPFRHPPGYRDVTLPEEMRGSAGGAEAGSRDTVRGPR